MTLLSSLKYLRRGIYFGFLEEFFNVVGYLKILYKPKDVQIKYIALLILCNFIYA